MTPEEFVGIFCLVSGLGLCLFGTKCQNGTLSFFGSGLGAFLFYLMSQKIEFGYSTQITLSIIMSVVFAFICMKFVRFSVLLIAIIHALCISNLMAPGLGHTWGQVVNYASLIILPTLFLYAPDVGILVSSSFFGAWIFVVGIEQFIGAGFPNPLVVLFNRNWDTLVDIEESAFLECLLVCSIMITALVIQIRHVETAREKEFNQLLKEISDEIDKIDTSNKKDEEQIVGEHPDGNFKKLLDYVTPDGEQYFSDKKLYIVEKFVGQSESAQPLIYK